VDIQKTRSFICKYNPLKLLLNSQKPLTRNRRQSKSASGNREALEEAENQYHFSMRDAVAAVAKPDGI
jgi:hypothetical protein